MSSFEERHVAWIDGRLSREEEAQFLEELAAHGGAISEKGDMLELGKLLREHGQPPALTNEDFFSNQVMDRIAAESAAQTTPKIAPRPPIFGMAWFWRMAMAGAACLAMAAALYHFTVPQTPGPVPGARDYVAQILETEPGDGITAMTYQAPKSEMTILWLEGLEYVPKTPATPTPEATAK